MALTGKKHNGSDILTEETILNGKKFYDLMQEIKQNNNNEYELLKEQMIYSMFNHLSHKHENHFIEWAKNIEYKTYFDSIKK